MEEKLLKSEERFREIFENAMDAIIIWADDGEIVRANESACRIFELPMHSLIGKNLPTFLSNLIRDIDQQEDAISGIMK